MRWRRILQVRIITMMLLIAVLGVLVRANLHPHNDRMLSNSPGGHIFAHDYGWPWTYQTEAINTWYDGFDEFRWWAVEFNVVVGLLVLLATAAVSESLARTVQRLAKKNQIQVKCCCLANLWLRPVLSDKVAAANSTGENFMADRPQKRRWFSFSLRAFLAGVFLIAIALGVLGHRWHRYQHQKATIDSLRSAGEQFEYYHRSRLPVWRHLLTNEQLADDIRKIVAYSGSLNERDLKSLRMFRRLETLWLRGASISDITPLAGLTHLKTLYLGGTKVADITPLEGLTQLGSLSLFRTDVTDMTPLAGLTRLKWLNLQGTQVTDLTPLAKLANVEIYVDDPDQLTIPMELQGRVH